MIYFNYDYNEDAHEKILNRLAETNMEQAAGYGCDFYCEHANRTNQIFPIFSDSLLAKLRKKYSFTYMERIDETHSAVRFCTSWATTKEQVAQLCEDIRAMKPEMQE